MHQIKASVVLAILMLVPVGCGAGGQVVRFATFNASLNRDQAGQLIEDLSTHDNPQARNIAEIIQRVRPDVLLINEFDYDESGRAPELFQRNYLSIPQNGAEPIQYPYRVYLPVNTGIPSGHDLDNDGRVVTEPGTRGYGNDSFGFGQFPGQYGMLLLSKFPIDTGKPFRTFQMFRWKDMPDAMLPAKEDGSPWYSDEALEVFRLSSKSHWDVPLRINRRIVHVLCSHPTPPAFDGPERRNAKRNHDEIRLWADFLTRAPHIIDDDGRRLEGYIVPPPVVILGDLNADPHDGGSLPGAIQQLLDHPRINASVVPSSAGAAEASMTQGGRNLIHRGDPHHDTADFSDDDPGPGNLRVDYVLPSRELRAKGGGVFWPESSDPLRRLVEMDPPASSDHRLVWLDVVLSHR